LETLKLQLPQATFRSFVESTRLIALEEHAATIELSDAGAKDWIENRLARQLMQLINIEGRSVNPKLQKVTELRVEIKS
jgi:chromosomal replication initiation ATPase DnaA